MPDFGTFYDVDHNKVASLLMAVFKSLEIGQLVSASFTHS